MLNNTKACFALRGEVVHNASPMGKGYTPRSGRSLRLLAALGLLLAACSGSDATPTSTTTSTTVAAATTTTSTTSTSTTTTTTSTSTTTTVPVPDDEGPPEIDLTVETCEDLDRWWVEANKFMEWAEAHPTDDLGVLSMLYHPDGPEIQEQAELFAGYVEDGIRLLNADLGEALSIGCPEELIPDGYMMMPMQSTQPEPAQFVDADGVVLNELEGWTEFRWRVELKRADDGQWLIWDFGAWKE